MGNATLPFNMMTLILKHK